MGDKGFFFFKKTLINVKVDFFSKKKINSTKYYSINMSKRAQ